MSTRVIRTAAALRPAGEWEQAIPLPAWSPVEEAAPIRLSLIHISEPTRRS